MIWPTVKKGQLKGNDCVINDSLFGFPVYQKTRSANFLIYEEIFTIFFNSAS
jgi:hypothetical protein